MKMEKKKLAAAMAAVYACIKTAEEASACAVAEETGPVRESSAAACQVIQQSNLWGVSGRQAHMQANSMMQLRMFK